MPLSALASLTHHFARLCTGRAPLRRADPVLIAPRPAVPTAPPTDTANSSPLDKDTESCFDAAAPNARAQHTPLPAPPAERVPIPFALPVSAAVPCSVAIVPVLLSGGVGSRLWPLSRPNYPKQFAVSVDNKTLLQNAMCRFVGDQFTRPIVITSEDYRFLIKDQWDTLIAREPQSEHNPLEPAALIEPSTRGTAAAVLAAALWVMDMGSAHIGATAGGMKAGHDPLILISPCDHAIADAAALRASITKAITAANQGHIVCFGICPDHASTAYGWIETPDLTTDRVRTSRTKRKTKTLHPVPIHAFVEKPPLAQAQACFASPLWFWNAGIFLARASTIIESFQALHPELLPIVRAALADSKKDLTFWRLGKSFEKAPDLDFNRAIMERINNRAMMPFAGEWSDLGDWNALLDTMDKEDSTGVVASNCDKNAAIDCDNSLLHSTGAQTILGVGLKDTLVVADGDTILVTHKDRLPDLGHIVRQLTDEKHPLTHPAARVYRPWGWYETLILSERFHVKRILVKPGSVLSLQSHVHRSEHWVVVSGTAEITIGDNVRLLGENESVYVPLGVQHRLANPGRIAMVLIEIQTGSYLGEDDIERYDDIYDRC